MSKVVSKAGIHCLGPFRDGYGPFCQRIAASGRQLAVVKCREDLSGVDEPLKLWPDVLTIGAMEMFNSVDEFNYATFKAFAQPRIKIKYWEVFNEIDGDWIHQADRYINEILPQARADGLRICLFNCATGTPHYPIVDPLPYEQIARVCKFARDGGYDVLLGLHEYGYDYSNQIGRYRVLADYLESRNALVPIVITEYGPDEGTFRGIDPFIAYVKENDPKYMADPRVVGCALWTLGGGGQSWGAVNFQTALPALGDYIATVPDTTPEPEPTMSKGGLHLSANGNNIDDPSLPKEIEAMKVAKITRCKFMSNGNPEFVHMLQANGIDLAGSVCRLYAAGDNTALGDPARFYLEQRAYITEIYGHGVRMFEIHNEPNLVEEGYGRFWNSPATFASNFYGPVARLILDNFPGVQIVYPGLAPRDDWAAWKPSITSLIAQGLVQLIGVHCYWDSAINARTAEQGRTFERFADMGKPLIITEASWNKPTGTDAQKGASYAEYIASLPSYVTAVYFFVSYGPAYDGSTETWVRGSPPALTAIPAAVGAGATPPPPTQFEFDGHYTFDGVLLSKAKDYGGVLTGDVEIETRYKRIVEKFTLQHRVSPPELSARVAATPAPGEYERGTAYRIVAT